MKQFRTPYFFQWLFHRRVWGFSRSKNTVFLTFDDGPTHECTQWILETLAKNNVKATFFCVGANAKEHPQLMDEIIAGGHAIGNHTMRHEKGSKTNREEYFRSISEASEHIDSNLFRPPYGRIPMAFTRELRKKYHIIMWTWLSYDYHADITASQILKRAETIKAGDILVLHDNSKSFEKIKEVLPELIHILQKKGLEFAPISA